MKRIFLTLTAARIVGLATTLSSCAGFRPVPVPDGYALRISHVNNVVGSHLAIYSDGSAVYRDLAGKLNRFQLSSLQARRLNVILSDPHLRPQLATLTARSTWRDAEEWVISIGGENFRLNCRHVTPLPAATELLEAAQSAARGGTREEWFLSSSRCFTSD